MVFSIWNSAPLKRNCFYIIFQGSLQFWSHYPSFRKPLLAVTPKHKKYFGKNQYSGRCMIKHWADPSPKWTFTLFTSDWKRTTLLRKIFLLNSVRVKHGIFSEAMLFYIDCSPRTKKLYPLPQRQSFFYPDCIQVWSVGEDFPFLFVWEWTSDKLVVKFLSRNVHFGNGFPIPIWYLSTHKMSAVPGSLLQCRSHNGSDYRSAPKRPWHKVKFDLNWRTNFLFVTIHD